MANIGDKLTSPEESWRRIDDTDESIIYDTSYNWIRTADSSLGLYNNTGIQSNNKNATITFNFIGTKIRIIGRHELNKSNNISVYMDNINYGTFSQYGDPKSPILDFEILNLNQTTHYMKMINNTTNYMFLDAIDIDKNINKYLIKQEDNYYTIQSDRSLQLLGIPADNTQLEQWFNDYGIDDINQLCTKYSTKTIVSNGESLGTGKLFTFNIPSNMKNINNVN